MRPSLKSKYSLLQLDPFIYELAHLLNAGIPILLALQIIMTSTHHKQHVILAKRIQFQLAKGLNFANAWQNITHESFSSAMLYAAENSGLLGEMLTHIHEYALQQKLLRQAFWQALRYPLFLLAMTVSLCIGLYTYVIPQFANLYANLNAPLPRMTLEIIYIGQWLSHHLPWCLSFFLIFFGLYRFPLSVRFIFIHSVVGYCLYQTPFYRYFQEVKYWQAVSYMLNAGVSLINALKICLPLWRHRGMLQNAEQWIQKLEQGSSLSEILKSSPYISPKLGTILSIGEISGRLNELLKTYTDEQQYQLQEKILSMKVWLEPIFLCIIGILIGGVLIALYLPVIQLGEYV